MLDGALIIWGMAAILMVLAARRGMATLREGVRRAWMQSRLLLLRVPLALLAAGFAAALVPQEAIATLMGEASGGMGILTASLLGGLLPGGPFVSFPIAASLFHSGAGGPQMVAFITAWSVFAVHRIISYELPLMGARFSAIRLLCSLVLPPLAGGGAALLWMAIGR